MRIEEGKYYRAANGEKIGPMMGLGLACLRGVFRHRGNDGLLWGEDGVCLRSAEIEDTSPYNLVAEWEEGPVRQEIIPGMYDGVRVGPPRDGAKTVPVDMVWGYYSADSLTRAAAVLTALAGALRDGE
jgi:hypothetical protein